MLRLTLLLSFGMFAALMTLGTDRGQLRPGLALAESEGRLDAVWAEARAAAEPGAAPIAQPASADAETVLASAQPEVAPAAAPPVTANTETLAEVKPLDTVVTAVKEPVFTLSALGNELVPGEDGTPVDAAALDSEVAAPAALAADSPEPARPEVFEGGQGTVWYVNASSVNVRAAPTTEAEVLGKLASGEAALMVASVGGEWAQIVIQGDGMEGYVALRYLTPEAP